LIDHTNGALIGFKPNRPPSLAINVHVESTARAVWLLPFSDAQDPGS
jgi:hypothetical protein